METAIRVGALEEQMVWIPGGTFTMGSDWHYPEEAPAHPVKASGFWMDRLPVTNAQFRTFVGATGYESAAERAPNSEAYPGADPNLLVAGSLVFRTPRERTRSYHDWWAYVPGADWQHPMGPDTSIQGLDRLPVVHVAIAAAGPFGWLDGARHQATAPAVVHEIRLRRHEAPRTWTQSGDSYPIPG